MSKLSDMQISTAVSRCSDALSKPTASEFTGAVDSTCAKQTCGFKPNGLVN